MHKVGILIRYSTFLLLIWLATACAQSTTNTPETSSTPFPKMLEPATAEVSSTPTTSPSPAPTKTPQPTGTFTPVPSPTLALPVSLKTQFPQTTEKITVQNVTHLRELANYGAPILLDFRVTDDRKRGVVLTSQGVGIFDLQAGQLLGNVPAGVCFGFDGICGSQYLSVNRDGSRFAIMAEDKAEVWDVSGGKLLEIKLTNSRSLSSGVVISPDGQMLLVHDADLGSVHPDAIITRAYDIPSGRELQDVPNFGRNPLIFSPDGRWLVEVVYPTATLWQVSGWSKQHEIHIPNIFWPGALSFSPDGYYLAYLNEGQIDIYQVSPWKLVRQISASALGTTDSAVPGFSPSGNRIMVVDNYYYFPERATTLRAYVWDIPTGQPLDTQEVPFQEMALSLSDDGIVTPIYIPSQVCLGLGFRQTSECTVNKWLIENEMDVRIKESGLSVLHRGSEFSEVCSVVPGLPSDCAQFSEPVFLDAGGGLCTVRLTSQTDIYEVYQGSELNTPSLGTFRASVDNFIPLWLSSDNRLMLIKGKGDWDQVELWDIQKQRLIRDWSGYYFPPPISPDGNFLASFTSPKFYIYSLQEDETIYTVLSGFNITSTPGFYSGVAPAFTYDGRLVYGMVWKKENVGYITDLMQFDLRTRNANSLIRFENISTELGALAVSPDGSLIAIGLPDGTIVIYDLAAKQELYRWKAHRGNITKLLFSPDGIYLVSAAVGGRNYGDGYLRLWGIWPGE